MHADFFQNYFKEALQYNTTHPGVESKYEQKLASQSKIYCRDTKRLAIENFVSIDEIVRAYVKFSYALKNQ